MKLMYNKLRRVGKKDRRIFGVCGGISKFLDPELDPVLIRILWIVLTIFSPVMLVFYLILAMALKVEDKPYEFDSSMYEKKSKDLMEVKINGKKINPDDLKDGEKNTLK